MTRSYKSQHRPFSGRRPHDDTAHALEIADIVDRCAIRARLILRTRTDKKKFDAARAEIARAYRAACNVRRFAYGHYLPSVLLTARAAVRMHNDVAADFNRALPASNLSGKIPSMIGRRVYTARTAII